MNNLIIPKHIGIIMDGNRRWAKEKGLPTFKGHKKGAETLKQICFDAKDLGIKTLTVYAFSTENWNRSKEEVNYLMDLFNVLIIDFQKKLAKENVRLIVLGDISKLNDKLKKNIIKIENDTKNNTSLTLNICLNYGGRDEIINAVNNILKDDKKKITKEEFEQYLYTKNQTDPEIIIRTSDEKRLSNFLLWQSSYSELFFIDKYWPDFNKTDLELIIKEFNERKRNFGK